MVPHSCAECPSGERVRSDIISRSRTKDTERHERGRLGAKGGVFEGIGERGASAAEAGEPSLPVGVGLFPAATPGSATRCRESCH